MRNRFEFASFSHGCRVFLVILSSLAAAMVIGALPVSAHEARPWLCRVKPVFSANRLMSYSAEGSSGRWRVTFMSFDPSGGHDGYTVVDSRNLDGTAPHCGGQLEGGTYFVVAQYAGASGEWICPGYVRDHDRPSASEITRICFGTEQSACAVEIAVRPAAATGH